MYMSIQIHTHTPIESFWTMREDIVGLLQAKFTNQHHKLRNNSVTYQPIELKQLQLDGFSGII